jgi:hypothetical protein
MSIKMKVDVETRAAKHSGESEREERLVTEDGVEIKCLYLQTTFRGSETLKSVKGSKTHIPPSIPPAHSLERVGHNRHVIPDVLLACLLCKQPTNNVVSD